uniref:Uncharacterized protein n=1 Tax=Lotharella globosa TaxID=91324 RepID=A0A7S3ZFV3_9EUKA
MKTRRITTSKVINMSYTRDNGNVQNFTQILLGASSVRPTDNLPELTSGSARVLSSVDTDLSSESERGVEAMCVAERVGWRSVTKAAPRMTCMSLSARLSSSSLRIGVSSVACWSCSSGGRTSVTDTATLVLVWTGVRTQYRTKMVVKIARKAMMIIRPSTYPCEMFSS